jgi:hypothetical protein
MTKLDPPVAIIQLDLEESSEFLDAHLSDRLVSDHNCTVFCIKDTKNMQKFPVKFNYIINVQMFISFSPNPN